MPTVSVILPTCDRPALWPRALDSIRRQTWTDFEVLLVDSNRESPPVREHPAFDMARSDPRVRLVEETPKPFSSASARNAGLRVAKGEWVTFLDDDDVYRPAKIAAQLARAQATGSSFVLCGYTVNLPRRRRTRQVHTNEYRGDALLTEATWATPMFFVRRDPDLHFDETLRAGEDEVFAHAVLARRGLTWVPNCAESLVDVFPQIGKPRVHANKEATWKAFRVNWRQTAGRFSPEARRAYLAMSRLVRAQGGYGDESYFVRCAWRALVVRGPRSWRLVLNATAHRHHVLERWLVS